MRTATFVVSKDPVVEKTGDMAMLNLVLDLARESMQVRYLALGPEPRVDADGIVLAKPAISAPRLLTQATRKRRSLVHERFNDPALQRAIRDAKTDIFVADHSYMAEPVLSSGRTEPLYVNTVVSESLVWNATYGALGRLQTPAIIRDQLRVARAAESVGTYDADERDEYLAAGIERATWLDLTLRPRQNLPERQLDKPRLAFVGDRQWRPNQEAAEYLMTLWPKIAEGIPGAELVIIGTPAAQLTLPEGVRELGFVPDLDAALVSVRGILAPIQTGGGVRVKILDATSRGIPIVGTPAAIGSLASTFGLTATQTDEEFIEASRKLLLDQEYSRREGEALYERNAEHWRQSVPQASVEEWLR